VTKNLSRVAENLSRATKNLSRVAENYSRVTKNLSRVTENLSRAALQSCCATSDHVVMRALSIRQPYAEQILRGEKTIEYRSRPTNIIGERFYIYASRQPGPPEEWAKLDCQPGDLPTCVIVGSAKITHCTKNCDGWEWHLSNVKRFKRPRKVKGQPQPVWFRPFSLPQ
jgi:hypothetical protein